MPLTPARSPGRGTDRRRFALQPADQLDPPFAGVPDAAQVRAGGVAVLGEQAAGRGLVRRRRCRSAAAAPGRPRGRPDDRVVAASEGGEPAALGEVVLVDAQLVGVHAADQQGEVSGGSPGSAGRRR